jgi:hypothetical protein
MRKKSSTMQPCLPPWEREVREWQQLEQQKQFALVQGQTGPSGPVAAGSTALALRQLTDGTAGVADCHARYTALVAQGNVYGVFDTVGHTIPAGLSTAPTTVSLYNPIGSGVTAYLLWAGVQQAVVNAAITALWIGRNPGQALTAVTGTALAVQNQNGGSGVGKISALTTATLVAAPTICWFLGMGLTGAVTTIPGLPPFGAFIDGLVSVAPGGALSFQASAATAASSSWGGWIWVEEPLVPNPLQ